MARSISEIEKDLFSLPIQERARIAHMLIRSLDKDKEQMSCEEGEAVWLEEIRRREEEIDSGKVKLVLHEEVMANLRSKYPKK